MRRDGKGRRRRREGGREGKEEEKRREETRRDETRRDETVSLIICHFP
jgi:hypothetical protein